MNTHSGPPLELGQVVSTPNALAKIAKSDITAALLRHVAGDWGDLCAEDKENNDQALLDGSRILSAYQSTNGNRFWIITEADRSVTSVLLPEDY